MGWIVSRGPLYVSGHAVSAYVLVLSTQREALVANALPQNKLLCYPPHKVGNAQFDDQVGVLALITFMKPCTRVTNSSLNSSSSMSLSMQSLAKLQAFSIAFCLLLWRRTRASRGSRSVSELQRITKLPNWSQESSMAHPKIRSNSSWKLLFCPGE